MEEFDPTVMFQASGARFDELKINDITLRQMVQLREAEGPLPEEWP